MKNNVGDARTHQKVWDLLPWYVNGTLSQPERAQVEAHLQNCEICRSELAMQSRLSNVVSVVEPGQQQTDQAWAKLETQIASGSSRTRPAGLAIAACLGLVAIGVATIGSFAPKEYEVLTRSDDSDATTAQLRVRAAPDATVAEVENVLRAAGLANFGELSETGVMVVTLDAEKDVAVLADILMSSPSIAYVAGDF